MILRTRPNGLPDRPEANAPVPLEGEVQAACFSWRSGDNDILAQSPDPEAFARGLLSSLRHTDTGIGRERGVTSLHLFGPQPLQAPAHCQLPGTSIRSQQERSMELFFGVLPAIVLVAAIWLTW